MADFRQLALEFVLAEEEAKLTSLAQQSASELAKAPANSNPVARWVEAVQPWMPSAGGDDEMADTFESTNWTARAKALEYLSRTLDYVDKDLLKPSQIKLLISFFSAMFDIDHKAGIMASSSALSRITAMKSFQPSSGDDIIKAVCTLRDDFPRQLAKTRLAVFELLRLLLSDPKVAADLRQKHGESSAFMTDLLKLCQNERDPNCLMVWFDILRRFLSEYEPSPQLIEDVYGTFKAYFPITLPRASQSGITPDELKMALRSCFTSNSQLAPHTFPFLIGKLDQGEGVTVNVKVDILRTIQACLEEYQNPEQSIAPYFEQVWSSLKYEVRNGEIEDTIFATLEVLKTFARRLRGDHLRDYALSVTRDCVIDLSNVLYTAAAGRLIVSVLSASPAAFVLMASPAITHIKENLRHPKSPSHGQDLFKLLHVILEARLLLADADMAAPERSDFEAIDTIFKSLYDEVYRKHVEKALDLGAGTDDLQTAVCAIQGVGALLCQRSTKANATAESPAQLLISQSKTSDVCAVLFSIVTTRTPGDATSRTEASDNLVNESIKALQRAVTAIPETFASLANTAFELISPAGTSANNVDLVHAYGPILAFIGCSELPKQTTGSGLANFLTLAGRLYRKLLVAIDTGSGFDFCSALVASLQSTIRHFNDACQTQESESGGTAWDDSWLTNITAKYHILDPKSEDVDESSQLAFVGSSATVSAIRSDFLLSSLAITRELYIRSTKPADDGSVTLMDRFTTPNSPSEAQYLNLLATLAGFTFHEMTEAQQSSLGAQNYALHLFRGDHVQVPGSAPEEFVTLNLNKIVETGSSGWDWLVVGRVNTLSLGILKALRPSVVSKLFDTGVAQDVLLSSATRSQAEPSSMAVAKSIVTILSNKHKIETSGSLMELIQARASSLLDQPAATPGVGANLDAISAIAAGMLRRNSGKPVQPLLSVLKASLQQSPETADSVPKASTAAARRLEALVTPRDILAKENFAIVRPLWTQKAYFDVVKPLLDAAAALKGPEQAQARANISTGVLLMVRHMPFAIYEDDAEDILRIAIAAAQRGVAGDQAVSVATSDVRAALHALRDILVGDKDKGKTHLKSIVTLCVDIFTSSTSSEVSSAKARSDPQCVKLALGIAGGLPNMFEAQHLLPYRSRVERELALACGNPVRELRKTARLAREAWDRLK